MSKPKFTPGPWKAGKNPCMTTVLDGHEGKAIYTDKPNDPHHIAWANAENSEGDLDIKTALANAALIAAAPDMYAALEEILGDLDTFPQVAPGVDHPEVFDLKLKLRKLLCKARGESEVEE